MSEEEQDRSGRDKLSELIPWIDELPIPGKIKKNTILALAKGVGNLITSALDVPIALFEGVSYKIRAKTAAEDIVRKAAAKSAGEQFKNDSLLAQRAADYYSQKVIEEQNNRENVAMRTINELRSRTFSGATETDIDPDWLTIFWRLAETKSNVDVQELLAKLLANEIEKPKSVSPHTLQLLSILTSDIAKSFERLCCLSIDDGNRAYVIHPHVSSFLNYGPLGEYGISYDDLFDLDGSGLIRSAETFMVNFEKNENSTLDKVDYAGSPALLNVSGKQLRLIQFTIAGRELRNLISLQRNDKFTQALEEKFTTSHFRSLI